MDVICPECGEKNAVGTEFCAQCHGYLGWQGAGSGPAAPAPPGGRPGQQGAGAAGSGMPPNPYAPSNPPSGPAGPQEDPYASAPPPAASGTVRTQSPYGQGTPPPTGPYGQGTPPPTGPYGQGTPPPHTFPTGRPPGHPVGPTPRVYGPASAGTPGLQPTPSAPGTARPARAPRMFPTGPPAGSNAGPGAPGYGGGPAGSGPGGSGPGGGGNPGYGAGGSYAAPYGGPSPHIGPGAGVPPTPCGTCGQFNDAPRRFCGRCGRQLIASSGGHQPPPVPQSAIRTWWQGLGNVEDRAARRAYRQSLPALYRWRRVFVTMICAGAVGGLLWGTNFRPLAYGMDRYWDNGRDNWLRTVPFDTSVVPAQQTATTLSALADGSEDAWTIAWDADTPLARCGGSASSPSLQLSWADPAAVQRVVLYPGSWDPDVRATQYRPTRVTISADGRCLTQVDVPDKAQRVEITIPGAPELTGVQIGFAAVAPPADKGEATLAVTEVRVLARPF